MGRLGVQMSEGEATWATYLLLPGAGGSAWYWHRVVADLAGRGHRAVAVEFPAR